MDKEEIIPKLALALIPGIGAGTARSLIARAESAEAIFRLKKRDLTSIHGIGHQLAERILKHGTFSRAEEEVRFIEKEKLSVRFLFDSDYPAILSQCPDAPIIFFFRGQLPLPGQRCLGIVGTRNPSQRGKQFTRDLVESIAQRDRSVIIISGLAYGIDIQAHLAALDSGLQTIAILGHGFHTLYPAIHRNAARRIEAQGCLITDFFSNNLPEPKNFIRRNRIIAGLTDATLVIESAVKGGAMVTAEMANSYNRDVFAVPGRPDDPMSRGCNYLIRTSQALLIESAEDLLFATGWVTVHKPVLIQPDLFNSLSADEKKIFDLIPPEPVLLDQIARKAGIPVQVVSAHLLSLEFKGLIKGLPGQQYTK